MKTTRRRLGMALVVAAGLMLLLTQTAAAYTTGNTLSASKADANNRAKLSITIVYDETSSAIAGTAGGDWGVRVTGYRVKYTNLNSSYFMAYIDVDGTIHSLGHCGSGGGASPGTPTTTRARGVSRTRGSPQAASPTRAPRPHRSMRGTSRRARGLLTGYGKATGYIYNKTTGNAAGSVACR